MFESLLKKPSGKGLLVLKTDCLGLHASIVTGNKQELSVTHSATSREVEPLAAMMDVITQLKNASGKNLPRDAVLSRSVRAASIFSHHRKKTLC